MGEVIDYAARAAQVRELLRDAAPPPVEIRSVTQALAWGDGWESHARQLQTQVERLEMLLTIAKIYERASALLAKVAEAECERLRGLI